MEASAPSYLAVRTVTRLALLAGGLALFSGCLQDWDRISRPDVGFEARLPETMTCGRGGAFVVEGTSLKSEACSSEASTFLLHGDAYFHVSWTPPSPLLDRPVSEGSLDLCRLGESSTPPPDDQRAELLGGIQGTECQWNRKVSAELPGEGRVEGVMRIRVLRAIHRGRLFELGMGGRFDPHLEGLWREMVASFRFVDSAPAAGARGN